MVVLFVSVDPLTPALILVCLVVAVPFSGVSARTLLGRTWPILLAALSVGILNAVFAAEPSGEPLLRIGPVRLGTGNLVDGLALGLRLVGIAFSGVLALATTDPTDLAGSLVQQLRLPARFAVGALAAARLLPILATEWQILSLARRARGVSAAGSPARAVRLFFGQLLALLVGAVRRGTRLAAAMEARGFGSRPCRSVARPQAVSPRDWMLIGGAAGVGAGAVALGLVLGSWRFLFG
jgi:energy-coupling factor transport system permease protein